MRLLSILALTLLGRAYAVLPQMKMLVDERPLIAVSVAPKNVTCSLGEPITTLDDFQHLIYMEELKGPCYYRMSWFYTGNVSDYLSETGQVLNDPRVEYLTFLVQVQAPIKVQTYIKTIHFEQDKSGKHCTFFRLSRQPTDEGETLFYENKAELEEDPRYFREVHSHDDKTPKWEIGGHQQLEGDYYLLEVPRGCLTNPTKLVIKTTHVFEDAALHTTSVVRQGKFIGHSGACSVPEQRMQIDTYEEYGNLIRRLPRRCAYAFQRPYAWVVPESHIFVTNGTTTVVAQIAVDEPMLGDHGREITRLSLGRRRGGNCSDVALYAQRKGTSEEADIRVTNLKLDENLIYVEAPWDFSDPIYDFRFVIPSDCTIEKPTVRVRVVDHKEADDPMKMTTWPHIDLPAENPPTGRMYMSNIAYHWNGTHLQEILLDQETFGPRP